MQVVHYPRDDGDGGGSNTDGDDAEDAGETDGDEGGRALATTADTADSLLAQARGLMFRRSIPDDYGLVFRFDAAETRSLHMLFVPFAIDAVWLVDGEVTKCKRLRPWVGLGWGEADTIIELPAGAADRVDVGDTVEIHDERERGAT